MTAYINSLLFYCPSASSLRPHTESISVHQSRTSSLALQQSGIENPETSACCKRQTNHLLHSLSLNLFLSLCISLSHIKLHCFLQKTHSHISLTYSNLILHSSCYHQPSSSLWPLRLCYDPINEQTPQQFILTSVDSLPIITPADSTTPSCQF